MANDLDRATQATMPVSITNKDEDLIVDVVDVRGVNRLTTQTVLKLSSPISFIRTLLGNLAVNGAGTPQVFQLAANTLGNPDILVNAIKFYGGDGNIKVQQGNFLGNNSALTNGILVEFIKNNVPVFSQVIKNTPELLAFSSASAGNKIIAQSGGDYIESSFVLGDIGLVFTLTAGANDFVRVTISDNLSGIDFLYALVDAVED